MVESRGFLRELGLDFRWLGWPLIILGFLPELRARVLAAAVASCPAEGPLLGLRTWSFGGHVGLVQLCASSGTVGWAW